MYKGNICFRLCHQYYWHLVHFHLAIHLVLWLLVKVSLIEEITCVLSLILLGQKCHVAVW